MLISFQYLAILVMIATSSKQTPGFTIELEVGILGKGGHADTLLPCRRREEGVYRNLAKSSEMISGVEVLERKGECRNLAKTSEIKSGVRV